SARVLAAGAVFALLLGGPLALLAGLPGAALLVPAIADGGGWPRAALGLLLAATLAGLLLGRPAATRVHLRVVDGITLALTAWLVVRPTAWAWAHVADADAYSDGTVLALASALIAGVFVTARRGSFDLTEVGPWLLIA